MRITVLEGDKRLRIEGTAETVRKAKADIQNGLFAKYVYNTVMCMCCTDERVQCIRTMFQSRT